MPILLALHGSSRDETDLKKFARRLAPNARLVAPRGAFTEYNGYTFFRRRPDHSIPCSEVLALARQWLSLEAPVLLDSEEKVFIAGYSSGAIFAEALLAVLPARFSGAILLRPEPLSDCFAFSEMARKPILLLAGRHDNRRTIEDAPRLAAQFKAAGAEVTLHMLECGHGWAPDREDVTRARTWLTTIGAD